MESSNVRNYDRVGRALLILRDGLRPFVARELEARCGATWEVDAQRVLDAKRPRTEGTTLDVAAIFELILAREFQDTFRRSLRGVGWSLVHQLLADRNRWAHQEEFSRDDAYYVLHSAYRLLAIVSAPQTGLIEDLKSEMKREDFEEHDRVSRADATSANPEVVVNEDEEALFALEFDTSRSAAERDRLRRALAVRLNDAPVRFSVQDEWLLLGIQVGAQAIQRPRIGEDGMGSIAPCIPPNAIELSPEEWQKYNSEDDSQFVPIDSVDWDTVHWEEPGPIPWRHELEPPPSGTEWPHFILRGTLGPPIVGPLRDEQNPFGLLYPRWQCPLWSIPPSEGARDPAQPLLDQLPWAPFIILEHPLPNAWIATTVPATPADQGPQGRESPQSRETFTYDDRVGYWRRTISQRAMNPEDLLLPQLGSDIAVTTQDLNVHLDGWIDRWLQRIDEYC